MVNLIECRDCEAGWQWPLARTEQQSVVEFKNSYSNQDQGSYFDPTKRDSVARCQSEFLETKIAKPGRLLDVGCGDGNFARLMAVSGWDVVGLDPATLGTVTEQKSNGYLRILPCSISDLNKGDLFDVVTLWDVVEHVENPGQLISEAVSHVAPGGCLVVETGNFQSAGRVESKGTWWNYQIDHRWYLAPPQLRVLMAAAGLEEIELADRVLRPWWRGQPDVAPPRLRALAKKIARRPWQFAEAVSLHGELKSGVGKWKGWSGLEIMTMVGHKAMTA
jgi:2-polyprenyl-3-methyl-5-hydroxy-6-metoxy-1,4-benzoquinol methylase